MRKSKILKSIIIIVAVMMINVHAQAQNVGIGSTYFSPDGSAQLEIQSTNKGLLIPRMTTTERDAISSPAQSLLIFNTTTKCYEGYLDGEWKQLACSFTCGTTVSYDGVTYNTVQIGNQCWMKENLRTTKYNDNSSISNVTDNASWTSTTSGAYCCYDTSSSYCTTYGALYNWYAVNTGKLCPTGWHVPSDAEWMTLEEYLGMCSGTGSGCSGAAGWRGTNEGSKLAGNASLWTDGVLEQNGSFNTSGFSALPGGYRIYSDGSFFNLGYDGYWWSSTEYDAGNAWGRNLYYNYAIVGRSNYNKRRGFSVRCLRD